MRDGITFIHLSDLHLGDPGDATLLSDTAAALADVVAMVARMAPAPSFVAISGDLSNRGDPASYRALRAALAPLPCPVFCGLGNHDDRRGYAAGWPQEGRAGDAPCFADHLVAGVHLVVLDTSVAGRVGGAIDARQFARLGAALDRHPEAPKVVALHHPPALGGEMAWETLDPADTARLAELLRGRGVAAVLCGHIHQDRVVMWEGIPTVTVSGLHAAIDPLHGDGLRSVRGASFGLCRLGPSGFAVNFVQLPSDRAQLQLIPREVLLGFA